MASIASDKLNIGTKSGIFYMRLQKATVAPSVRDLVGVGLKVNYLYTILFILKSL